MPHTTKDLFRMLGASNHCEEEREVTDFYSTDPDCIDDLFAVEEFSDTILEPCCGSGNLSKKMEEYGKKVISTDLYDHGYGKSGIDFFTYKDIDCDLITNPPYTCQTEIVDHALKVLRPGRKMAMFLKIQFLEGQERLEKIYKQMKLKTVYVYSKRVACYKNDERYQKNEDGTFKLDRDGNKKKIGSAACYCWFIFDTTYNGFPTIKWIAPKEEVDDRLKPYNLFSEE